MVKQSVLSIAVVLSVVLAGCLDKKNHSQSTSNSQVKEALGASISTIIGDSISSTDSEVASQGKTEYRQSRAEPQDPNMQIENTRRTAITRAVEKVSPAVVSITVTEMVQGGRRLEFSEYYNRFVPVPIEREVSSIGSGFIISSDGLVVTNQHVANRQAKRVVVSLPDGSQYEAEVLGEDELADLSLLRIKADKSFPSVDFGDSDSVLVGEWSLAVGNPFGLFESAKPSVTVGVVSAVNRDFRPNPQEPRVYMDMIQTDAAINRGNSGGPLVDSEGNVIGVNTFIFTGGTSGGNVGLGFAIPSNRVQKIIEQLSTEGEVTLPYDPGFNTIEMTRQLVMKYNLPATRGLLVNSVNKDGPAFEAGIVPGDIILKIGEERIQSKMHAQALFREYQEGDSMRVELFRKGDRYETKMFLRKKVKQ
jgi:serine protease Do